MEWGNNTNWLGFGIILPIHTNGEFKDCNNYRAITLFSLALKVYEKILDATLRPLIESAPD